ncbi:hypothetical protein GCM10028790_10010 [Micromonospora taraxaci]
MVRLAQGCWGVGHGACPSFATAGLRFAAFLALTDLLSFATAGLRFAAFLALTAG